MPLKLQPIRVAVEENADGALAFHDGALVAVLVRLGPAHGEQEGWWFLEAGFGPLAVPDQPVFPTLHDAEHWIARRLAAPAAVPRSPGGADIVSHPRPSSA